MANLSDYAETLLLNWLMTSGGVTRPAAWYLALYTAAPSDAGGGTEVAGNGYARQGTAFAAASSPGGNTTNSNQVQFAAAGGNWGTVTHIGIFDAAINGNLLWHGPMSTSRVVNDGDTLTFAAGSVSLTLA